MLKNSAYFIVQQLVWYLKSHAVWLARIACEDDGLPGPCMVLWEELITGLLFSSSVVVIVLRGNLFWG